MQSPEISILIPTKNEPGIALVIQEIKSELADENYEILVVDKSDDNTAEIAKNEGVKIYKQLSKGYGNAYIEGFQQAQGNIIVMIDGDDSYNARDVPKMLDALRNEHYDLVLGNRFADIKSGAMSHLHRFGNHFLTFLINLLFRTHVDDSQCGLRVLTREMACNSHLESPDMGFASEMVIKAHQLNKSIKNIPISYFPRKGKSKMLPWRNGFSILYQIIRYYFKKKEVVT
jgi:glycosyltransferase involved in cell wall biosynthesis